MKPMLAFRENPILKALHWPKLLSPKFDGIRAIRPLEDFRLHTRKLKLVPNIHVRERFCHKLLDGMDGELIVGDPTDPLVYSKTESVVMSYAPPKPADDVRFFLFDYFGRPTWKYRDRLQAIKSAHALLIADEVPVVLVEQRLVKTPEEALEYEEELVSKGYEGMMIRDPRAPYKYGRSTLSEEYLLKFKRFEDSEAVILSVEEQMENTNEAKANELGYMKRSKKQEGMVGKNTLGAFVCYDKGKRWEFRCGMGPGLTDALRKELWDKRKSLVGKVIKYRWQPAGTKDKPRSPRFMGFRDRRDM